MIASTGTGQPICKFPEPVPARAATSHVSKVLLYGRSSIKAYRAHLRVIRDRISYNAFPSSKHIVKHLLVEYRAFNFVIDIVYSALIVGAGLDLLSIIRLKVLGRCVGRGKP
eukprot:6213774-Pleurochrysis_carterae.AAC.4